MRLDHKIRKGTCILLAGAMLAGCSGSSSGGDKNSTSAEKSSEEVKASSENASKESSTENTETKEDETAAPSPVKEVYHAVLPTAAEESEIYVKAIEGISDDFIRGMDISSVIAEEQSGVKYYDENGNETDLFRLLADAGINMIRVRVWNDPYDRDGNGYGGGNNDVAKAAEIGRRAAENGMKLCVDFHYSDFWADPAKQFAPKAWAHVTTGDKVTMLHDFTLESLNTIKEAGADIAMVQIGNEINGGLAGTNDTEKMMDLLKSGSAAVREFDKDVKIAVHYTNIDDHKNTLKKADTLRDYGVDYDIFGVSYYPFWHGAMDDMTELLKTISAEYGKETCILETSYAYTLEDGDSFGNSVSESDLMEGYAATVQSQATAVRDVCAAANEGGALGVFYWEGAWVPVGSDYDSNAEKWEKYGSGWASSYAKKYDPDDAGEWYGGCSWDNQAFFDFGGKKLPSLDVWKYLKYGTICDTKVDFLKPCQVFLNLGEELKMPETIEAVMNDRSENDGAKVTWDADEVAAIDTGVMADTTVHGKLEDGTAVSCLVRVAKLNYVLNPSFEENNTTMWKVEYSTDENPTDFQKKSSDAYTGDYSFHFWTKQDYSFTISQTVTGLSAGSYTLTDYIQGGDVGKNANIILFAEAEGKVYESDPVTLSGWVNWKDPKIENIVLSQDGEITIGMKVTSGGGGWGTMDDFYLYKQ